MKNVLNATRRAIRVPLPGGHVLHLSPNRTGQVSDEAVERPAFRRLVERGEIEVLGEDAGTAATPAAQEVQESPHGHPPRTIARVTGNRPGPGVSGRGRT